MPVGARADPDVGPGGRDRERLDAVHLLRRPDRSAPGVQVGEALAGLAPPVAGLVVVDVAQAVGRGLRGVRHGRRASRTAPATGSGAKPTATFSSSRRVLLVREVAQHAVVGGGGRLRDAPGPQTAGEHDVDLGRVDGQLGDEREPGHEAEHEAELPVDRLRVLELVLDEGGSDGEQHRVTHAAHQRPGHERAGADRSRREHAERGGEQGDVDDEQGDEAEHAGDERGPGDGHEPAQERRAGHRDAEGHEQEHAALDPRQEARAGRPAGSSRRRPSRAARPGWTRRRRRAGSRGRRRARRRCPRSGARRSCRSARRAPGTGRACCRARRRRPRGCRRSRAPSRGSAATGRARGTRSRSARRRARRRGRRRTSW